MKSKVFGCGRNLNHRPKRAAVYHAAAGSFNLNGKKSMSRPCGCCVIINVKNELKIKQDDKENSEYLKYFMER